MCDSYSREADIHLFCNQAATWSNLAYGQGHTTLQRDLGLSLRRPDLSGREVWSEFADERGDVPGVVVSKQHEAHDHYTLQNMPGGVPGCTPQVHSKVR